MKRLIMFVMTAALTISLAACSGGDNSSSRSGSADSTSSVSSTNTQENNNSPSAANSEDSVWTDYRPSGVSAVFQVPTDMQEKGDGYSNVFLVKDEKLLDVIVQDDEKTDDLEKASDKCLHAYFLTAEMSFYVYDDDQIPDIIKTLNPEKKTVNGIETNYYNDVIEIDNYKFNIIGYTFIIHSVPCAVIAQDIDAGSKHDEAWREATKKELEERVEYIVNHIEVQ